jgi:centrosomal protein CEP41
LYHLEEKKGINPAKIFFEKGFDNVYLLTGGLEEFHSVYPDYIEGGDIPIPKPLGKRISKTAKMQEVKTQERKKTIL